MPYITNSSDGVTIYYEVEGTGSPLVLYPGATFSHHVMRESGYTEAFGSIFQTILLDPRGTGRSDKPHDSSSYTLDRLVTDVVAILDELQIENTHFLGYSRGGWVGFGIAVSAPERLLSLVAGGIHPYPRGVGTDITDMSVVVDFLETNFGPLPPDTRADLLASDIEALKAASAGVNESVNLERELPDITTPCFVYCGKQDQMHDGAMQAASVIPPASFLSIHGFDHISAGGSDGARYIIPHILAFFDRVEAEQS